MDPWCADITVALYREERGGTPVYRVRSYSRHPRAEDRLAFICQAMKTLGGLAEADGLLRFPCGRAHLQACRRVFLEACKLETGIEAVPKPLAIVDRKSGLDIAATGDGHGTYEVTARGEPAEGARRVAVVVNGLAKLGEMERQGQTAVRFDCGAPHDALAGLLLVRAPNVRAVLREEESVASRGVLAAPSQQR